MPAKCCASSTSTSAYSSFLNLNLLLFNQLQSQTLLFLLQLLQTLLRSLRWTRRISATSGMRTRQATVLQVRVGDVD